MLSETFCQGPLKKTNNTNGRMSSKMSTSTFEVYLTVSSPVVRHQKKSFHYPPCLLVLEKAANLHASTIKNPVKMKFNILIWAFCNQISSLLFHINCREKTFLFVIKAKCNFKYYDSCRDRTCHGSIIPLRGHASWSQTKTIFPYSLFTFNFEMQYN